MKIDESELFKRLILADASFLTAKEKLTIAKTVNSAESLADMSLDDLQFSLKRVFSRCSWNGRHSYDNAVKSLQILKAFGIGYTCIDSADFPAMLREMKDPPFMIFYRGNLGILNKQCVSVVGTRHCTLDAKNAAEEFSTDAANDDCVVVSGLAFGIDACAHKGALRSDLGGTAAVLPSGIDNISPKANTRLAAKILERGGVILSEYTPGTPAMNFRYVQRNRIVAALSPATVVIQAPPGSGAMITAGLALDYNRELYFHGECFSKESEILTQSVIQKLKSDLRNPKAAENKLNNSPAAMVKDGAQIIKNYSDYKKYKNFH